MEAKYIQAYATFEKTDDNQPSKFSNKVVADLIGQRLDSTEPFAIISAYVPGNAPNVMEENHEKLRMELLKMHYGCYQQIYGYEYTDGTGHARVERKSIFIPDAISLDKLLELGKKYDQETIAVGGDGKLDVIRVSDERVVLSMTNEDLYLAFNLFLSNPRQTPW